MVPVMTTFDRLDTRMNRWLVTHSIPLLRVSIGLVFVLFGALKFVPGMSPIQDLVTRTTTALSFGVLPPLAGLFLTATLETAIGLCLISGRLLRIGVWLMAAQLLGAMSPLLLFPGEMLRANLSPTLTAQYILKDVVLLAAALVLASTWSGARIVAAPRGMRSSLREPAPRVLTEKLPQQRQTAGVGAAHRSG